MNRSTGKESTWQTGFSHTTWGTESRSYAKSARTLSKSKFDSVVEEAQTYVKRRKVAKTTDVIDIDEEDARGCFVASGSDEECK